MSELYQLAFDESPDAMFLLDTSGFIIESNPAACRQVGRTRQKLRNADIRTTLSTDSIDAFSFQLEQAKNVGTVELETVYERPDGTSMYANMRLTRFHQNGRDLILSSCRAKTGRLQHEIEYEKLIEATGEGFWIVNIQDATILDANEVFCRMVGYTREELLGMTISDLEVVESSEETAAHIRKIIETGYDIFETKHRHKDGHIVDIEVSVSYADIRGGIIFVFVRDIAERKRQRELMQLSSLVIKSSSATVMVTNAENRIISVNPAFSQITGYQPEEVIGHNPNLLSSGRQSKAFYRQMWQTLLETGQWEGEWWNKRRNGEEYAEHVNLNVLRDEHGEAYRYVKIATDVTEKRLQEDQVWYQANYDIVTGLPNRRLFRDRLSHELKKSNRTGESLALFYIDLDNFKNVNDAYGHETGDLLLIEASRRISRCIRSTDTVARLGGDEFAVLLIDLSDISRVDTVADNINRMLAQPFLLSDVEVTVSASVGIAIYPRDADEINDLIRKADHAMYKSKRGGKNRHTYSLEEA